MPNTPPPGERVRRLLDALAEDTMEVSDDEIDEEIRAGGEDPEAIAARMREMVNALLKEHER